MENYTSPNKQISHRALLSILRLFQYDFERILNVTSQEPSTTFQLIKADSRYLMADLVVNAIWASKSNSLHSN